MPIQIPHYENVDSSEIRAIFTPDRLHRAVLKIPLRSRDHSRTICIVGQNPSEADERFADRTVRFLERFVFECLPEYGQILMLNLYSRVDTRKEYVDPLNHQCDRILRCVIRHNDDFLAVFGELKNEGPYQFPARVRELQRLFKDKNLYKFDIGSAFAPHPGNPKICYSNFGVGTTKYAFEDVSS